MSQKEKLLTRLLSKPKDFTWDELHKVMSDFGYRKSDKGKTSGSRVRFVHKEYAPLNMHKPHPKQILKSYQIENVIEHLKQEDLI